MKKTIMLVVALAMLCGCISRNERIKNEASEEPVLIQGHEFALIHVGAVSGQSNGYVYQLVHLPECKTCKERRKECVDTILKSIDINTEIVLQYGFGIPLNR